MHVTPFSALRGNPWPFPRVVDGTREVNYVV